MPLLGEAHGLFIRDLCFRISHGGISSLNKVAPGARLDRCAMVSPRVFKSKGFAKQARQSGIADKALCKAFAQALLGQADSLGGGVYKKRLNDNLHRAIILVKTDHWGVFEFLYAKQDKSNLSLDELKAFRLLANGYARLNALQFKVLLADQALMEICRDETTHVQK